MINVDHLRYPKRPPTASAAAGWRMGLDARQQGLGALARLGGMGWWVDTGRTSGGRPVLRWRLPVEATRRAEFGSSRLADAYYRRVGEVGKRLKRLADRRRQEEESRQWSAILLGAMMRLPVFPFVLRDSKAWWNRV